MATKNKKTPRVINIPDGCICDYIDYAIRPDTPEEYVRQTIEKRLVNELDYSREQIAVEFAVAMGSKKKFADLVIFGADKPQTQENALIIVECKRESVNPAAAQGGVEQLKSYMAACPNCEWGMWTNGKQREVWRKTWARRGYQFQKYNDIPAADGNVDEIDRPSRGNLKRASDDNLLLAFRACHNRIYATEGMPKDKAFFELLKLIFCKTHDEQNIGSPLNFYAKSEELDDAKKQKVVKKRIGAIFEDVKKRHPLIFADSDELELGHASLSHVVAVLQSYSLLDTHIDVKGKAYEEFVGANLRGDRGEFFTPRNVVKMAVNMLAPTEREAVCDPACGTGGFLVMAMKHVIDRIKSAATREFNMPEKEWGKRQHSAVSDKIRETAAAKFFGFDISQVLVRSTKMNMVMNNDGSGNIYQNDSLLPPQEWSPELVRNLARALGIGEDAIANGKSMEWFDVIFANPPFGSKIPIDGPTLGQYVLGYIWRNTQQTAGTDGQWETVGKLQKSAPPEQLFVERCLQFLKPGGRLAIVLPDSILSNPGLGYIRQWLTKKVKIVASIDLHADTFQPRNGTQTSVLIMQKMTREEERDGVIRPHPIFMAVAEKIGHDKRGNTIYVRDEDGMEIWVDDEEQAESAGKDVKQHGQKRIIDDDTVHIAEYFAEWKKQEGIPW